MNQKNGPNVRFNLPGNGGKSGVDEEDSVVNWKAPFEVEGSAFF